MSYPHRGLIRLHAVLAIVAVVWFLSHPSSIKEPAAVASFVLTGLLPGLLVSYGVTWWIALGFVEPNRSRESE